MPARSGTSSDGPTATTVCGWNGARAARATGESHVADDRELARRAQPEVDPAEHPREEAGRATERGLGEPEDRHGAPLELVVAPDAREAQEDVREHRVARRDRGVLEVLRARDARVAVGGREEEAAVHVVREELDGEEREPTRFEQPAKLARGDVQLD